MQVYPYGYIKSSKDLPSEAFDPTRSTTTKNASELPILQTKEILERVARQDHVFGSAEYLYGD